jgi:hypothetical protein
MMACVSHLIMIKLLISGVHDLTTLFPALFYRPLENDALPSAKAY